MIEKDRAPYRTLAATATVFLPAAPVLGVIDGMVGTPEPVDAHEEAEVAARTVRGSVPKKGLHTVVLLGMWLFNVGRRVGAAVSK
jgi:hypothetical protein